MRGHKRGAILYGILGGMILSIGIKCMPVFGLYAGDNVKEEKEIQYEYDELNRLVRVIYPDGTEVLYKYDRNGNLIDVIVIPPKSTEHSSESTERTTESTEHSSESTERTTESTERSSESTEQTTESTERSSEGTERTTESAEASTESTVQATENAEAAEGTAYPADNAESMMENDDHDMQRQNKADIAAEKASETIGHDDTDNKIDGKTVALSALVVGLGTGMSVLAIRGKGIKRTKGEHRDEE